MTVVHLILVLLLADGATRTKIKEFPTVALCKAAEEGAHEAAKLASDVVDVGTICVKSDFDPKIKPSI